MKFFLILLVSVLSLSVFGSSASSSFNTLLGASVVPQQLDAIETKSGDPFDILGQLSQLLSQPEIFSQVYENYKILYKNGDARLDSNVTVHHQIFALNSLQIAEHNLDFQAGKESYEMGLNRFTDMTEQEIQSFLGYRTNLSDALKESDLTAIDLTPTPQSSVDQSDDSLDWRDRNAVTPIKDQGSCGSCITFSVAGTLESSVAKDRGQMLDLSEQELVDCTFPENKGCFGGQFAPALRYIKQKGLVSEEEYPYKGTSGLIPMCNRGSKTRLAQAASYGAIQPKGSEDAMKLAVAQYGPLAISVHTNQAFQNYKSGIFKGPCPGSSNHALMVVGYGSENGQAYWIIKNSWGTKWGENGYMRLARNFANLCNVASEASYVAAAP